MRRYLKSLLAFVVALAFCGQALAANLPPANAANSSFSPPNVNDFNALINQLNGGPGYTGTPQVISLGFGYINRIAILYL